MHLLQKESLDQTPKVLGPWRVKCISMSSEKGAGSGTDLENQTEKRNKNGNQENDTKKEQQ
jgi:hypothetical protein